MKLRLVAFGIAKDILTVRNMHYTLMSGDTIAALKEALHADYPEFDLLNALSFAVNEEYVRDDFSLREGDEVVLIPPVSGG